MKERLSKQERIDAILKEVFGGVKTRMAERLGVDPVVFNMRMQRGTWYDAVALKEAMPELNDTWLLTGEGEMLKNED